MSDGRINPTIMMLDANINTQFSTGSMLTSTGSLSEQSANAQVQNQTDWAYGVPGDPNDKLGPTGQPLPSNLLGTNDSPLQFVPGSKTDLMYYNNAQIQEMITYFANEAQGKTGSSLTQIQLQMQPWTNAGQLSSAQSSNQQGQLKNTSDTWTQQLQAVQGNLTSAVQAGNTAVGLQSYAAQVLGSGTS